VQQLRRGKWRGFLVSNNLIIKSTIILERDKLLIIPHEAVMRTSGVRGSLPIHELRSVMESRSPPPVEVSSSDVVSVNIYIVKKGWEKLRSMLPKEQAGSGRLAEVSVIAEGRDEVRLLTDEYTARKIRKALAR